MGKFCKYIAPGKTNGTYSVPRTLHGHAGPNPTSVILFYQPCATAPPASTFPFPAHRDYSHFKPYHIALLWHPRRNHRSVAHHSRTPFLDQQGNSDREISHPCCSLTRTHTTRRKSTEEALKSLKTLRARFTVGFDQPKYHPRFVPPESDLICFTRRLYCRRQGHWLASGSVLIWSVSSPRLTSYSQILRAA